MLKLVQMSVRGAVRGQLCLPARRVPAAAARAASESAAQADGRSEPRRVRTQARSCVIDPNLQEQFVFLDYTDLEEDHHQKDTDSSSSSSSSSAAPLVSPEVPPEVPPDVPPEVQPAVPPQRKLRSLERQLQALRTDLDQRVKTDSFIEFHDIDYPLDDSIMSSKKKKGKKKVSVDKGEHKVVGTPDVDVPFSNTSCSGCGAILHCTATDVPGYLPSEKFKELLQEERLGRATCQRCYLLTHHHKALNLQMSADQYRAVVQQIRPLKALVLLIVDLLDVPDSIIPDLRGLVGTNKHIVVLGNKIDLLPQDAPNYLARIKQQLSEYCHDAGFGHQVTDIHLISAKTGYGIEGLISSLQRSWKYKGDVYLVGCANAGKSTLFNTLLESDYCKSKASDVIQKATISPWPGTTLNLLKFPIINPTAHRISRREERLTEAAKQTESELSPDELKRLKQLSRQAHLIGRVGRTFQAVTTPKQPEIEFDPDSLAFGETEDGEVKQKAPSKPVEEFTHNELKYAHWLFDTPGIMKEHDILSLLMEQEVALVVPSHAIIPRTFVLKPGMSLFIGALGRIDFLQGTKSCWFSVVASSRLPVHITTVEKADGVYEKHAGHVLLGVPQGGSERMKDFPALVPQDFTLEGRGFLVAAADIKLSSAGWVAVTADEGDQLLLKVHSPASAAFRLRTQPLLPHIVTLKGERIKKSAAYKTIKPQGMLDSGLSAQGAERLKVKNKKKKK